MTGSRSNCGQVSVESGICLMYCVVFLFFFFKQKTAYEIGTGDWSSDVCSSDLLKISQSVAINNGRISIKSKFCIL